MTHVLLVGAYGQGNPGDEALCRAFRTSLRRCSLTIATAASRPRVDGVRTIDPARSGGRAGAARHRRRRGRRWHGVQAVAPLDGPAAERPAARHRWLDRRGARSGAAVALVGVGAGHLGGRESKVLARWIVRHSDLLVLRDEESASVLAAAGAAVPFRIGADPTWVLAGGPGPRSVADRRGRAVTVAVSHLAGDDTLVDRLAMALAPLAGEIPIRVQPWQTETGERDAIVRPAARGAPGRRRRRGRRAGRSRRGA